MERPNIFKYATKELSQDAMICWFLACLNSEDDAYKKIGLAFVRFIFKDIYDSIESAELFDKSHPKTQYEKIDVYAEIVINGKTVHPVIFEDKTNTYLHSNQMYKYIEKINNEANSKNSKGCFSGVELGNILYVYFKTGFASKWERKDIKDKQISISENIPEVSFKEIYLKEMVEFISDKNLNDILFTDYKNYLSDLSKVRNDSLNTYGFSIPECLNALDKENQAISSLLLDKVFKKNCYCEYTANKKLAIVYPFYSIDENQNKIFYNLGVTGKNRKYYFRFEQWQKENKCPSKRDEALEVQNLCISLTEKSNISFEFPVISENLNNSYKIFKLSINGNQSLEEICNALKTLIDNLLYEFKYKFKELDVTKEKDWESK